MTVRLQKFLADAGVASRRAGEEMILAGQVSVNGEVIRTLGTKVDPLHDRVTVDGRAVKAKKKLYIAVHKPPGYICSRSDPEQRRTVEDLFPKEWGGILHSVGRLDFKSEGLIFYTNDGDFSLRMTHPRYGVRKKYLVTLKGEVTPEHIRTLQKGGYEGGGVLRAVQGRIIKSNKSPSPVEVVSGGGKQPDVERRVEVLSLHM